MRGLGQRPNFSPSRALLQKTFEKKEKLFYSSFLKIHKKLFFKKVSYAGLEAAPQLLPLSPRRALRRGFS
jgi:hypothetical protein